MRLAVTIGVSCLLMMFLSMLLSSYFLMRRSAEEGPLGPGFDPTKHISIEVPGHLIRHCPTPILQKSSASKTGEISYEIQNNVLEYRKKHYQLKTGDYVKFEDSGSMVINGHRTLSTEELWAIATSINGRFP